LKIKFKICDCDWDHKALHWSDCHHCDRRRSTIQVSLASNFFEVSFRVLRFCVGADFGGFWVHYDVGFVFYFDASILFCE